MSEILDSEKYSIGINDYKTEEDNINNDFNISLSIIKAKSGKLFLKREYERSNDVDQKNFFRDLVFSLHCEHPLISKFGGYTFFDNDNNLGNFVIISEYPKNGFLMDYLKKSKFNNTQKSKYLFGTALIGSFLHSRDVSHRCFAPPSLGVDDKLNPILLMFSTSKSLDQKLNETLQVGNLCWLSPEQESDELEYDKSANWGVDVFSFGSLLYYLFTGKVPFYSENIFDIFKKKREAHKLVKSLSDMPDDLAQLLKDCWHPNIYERPKFNQILLTLQSHKCLFPGTDLADFDEYVQEKFSIPISSNIYTIAPENLGKSVNTVYASLITDQSMRTNPEVLNALYTIREQVESYKPVILQCKRGGCSDEVWIKVPSFMFIESLKYEELNSLYNLPPEFQIIELKNNQLADKPYLTVNQYEIENGNILNIYNALYKSTDDICKKFSTITLKIPTFGELKTSYNAEDTTSILINDISFHTRVPSDKIKLKVKAKEYSLSDKKLGEIGINEDSIIDVIFANKYEPFDVTIDLDGVIGRSGTVKQKITSIVPISKIMESVGVKSSDCFAVVDNQELSPYKALIDYGIALPVTIELNTLIPDE